MILLTASGLLKSLFMGLMPSSPYLNWIIIFLVPDRAVVLHFQILQCINKPSLQVTDCDVLTAVSTKTFRPPMAGRNTRW